MLTFLKRTLSTVWRFSKNVVWYTTLLGTVFQPQRVYGQLNDRGNRDSFDEQVDQSHDSYFDIDQQMCITPPHKKTAARSSILDEFCQQPVKQINRIAGATYKVVTRNDGKKTLLGNKFFTKGQIKHMSGKIARSLNIGNQFAQRIDKHIEGILGRNIEHLTSRETRIINLLKSIIVDGFVQFAIKEGGMCGQSVNRSIGQIITHSLLQEKPIPNLIAFSAAFDFDYNNDPKLIAETGQHLLDQHISLLVVEAVPAHQEIFKKFTELFTSSTSNNGEVNSNHEQLIKLLKQMNSQVCDAWIGEHDFLNKPRNEDDFFKYVQENPKKILQIRMLTNDDLTFSPWVEKIVEEFFLSPEACVTWLDQEYCENQAGSHTQQYHL